MSRRRERGSVRLARLPLLLAAGVLLLSARPSTAAGPDWLAGNLLGNAPAEDPATSAVQLLSSTEVRFLAADQTWRQSRGVVKIITDTGREQARLSIPYNAETDHIVSARAWIVAPDGRRTQAFGRGDFADSVAQYNQYFWDAQRVLRFDGSGKIAVGGVLAWEVQIEAPSGVIESRCRFLAGRPVVHAVFEAIPPLGRELEWHSTSSRVGPPSAGGAPGALRWEAMHLAPLLAGRPAGFQPNPLEISVRLATVRSPAGRPITWDERSELAAGIMEPRMDRTGAVKAMADAVVAEKSGRWDRIRALTEFIQRDIVYLEISLDKDCLAGFRPHPAPEVLRNRYGDCKDKATLLVSMLRALGENGFVVLLNAGNPIATSADWPSLGFNHAIVALPADDSVPAWWPVVDAGPLGRLVIFDPTDSKTPLGVLSPGDQGGFGLIVSARQGKLVSLPISDAMHSGLVRTTKGQVNGKGELQASVEEVRHGLLAAEEYALRRGFRGEQFKRSLEATLHLTIPLVQGLDWTDTWDAAASRYQLNQKFSAPRFARALGSDTMLVAPQIFPSAASLAPWTTTAEGVAWLQTTSVREDARLTMPPGYSVEELPEAWRQDVTSASGQLSYGTEGNEIVYRWQLTRRGGFYTKPDYESLRILYQKLYEAQRRPVVLHRTANTSVSNAPASK